MHQKPSSSAALCCMITHGSIWVLLLSQDELSTARGIFVSSKALSEFNCSHEISPFLSGYVPLFWLHGRRLQYSFTRILYLCDLWTGVLVISLTSCEQNYFVITAWLLRFGYKWNAGCRGSVEYSALHPGLEIRAALLHSGLREKSCPGSIEVFLHFWWLQISNNVFWRLYSILVDFCWLIALPWGPWCLTRSQLERKKNLHERYDILRATKEDVLLHASENVFGVFQNLGRVDKKGVLPRLERGASRTFT